VSFLTDSEIEFYTGYKQPAAQIRFLRKNGIRHVVTGTNKVRVTWEAVNNGGNAPVRAKARVDLSVFDEGGN
jgi:hypothetical protein